MSFVTDVCDLSHISFAVAGLYVDEFRQAESRKRQHGQGDITQQVRGSQFTYEVESTAVVPPTAIEVLKPHGRDELTPLTCYPFNYLGHAPNRFIVHAHKSL